MSENFTPEEQKEFNEFNFEILSEFIHEKRRSMSTTSSVDYYFKYEKVCVFSYKMLSRINVDCVIKKDDDEWLLQVHWN